MQSRLFIPSGLVGDNWNFNASNPVVYVGGNYNQNGNHGMFYVNYTSLTNTNDNHGSRLLFKSFANVFPRQQTAAMPFCIHSTDSRAPHGEDQLIGSGLVHHGGAGALERPCS